MWDLIVSVPDHCLSFYFVESKFRRCTTTMVMRMYHYACI